MAEGVAKELKVLSKHSAVYGISNILNRIVSFALLPVYTRFLTPADYGVMDLIYFTTAFIGMVIGMGINQAMARFYFDSEDQTQRNLAVSSAFYGFSIGSGVIILLFIAASGWLNNLVFPENNYTNLLVVALVGLGFDVYLQIGFTYLRIRQQSVRLMKVSVVRLVLQLSLNILFVVVFEWGVLGILLSTLIVNVLVACYLIPSMLRETGLKFSRPLLKEMIRYGLPLIPSDILAYTVSVSDRYFLNAFSGLSATGIYSVGYRFGVLVNTFVASPFAQIWTPRRFEMHKDKETDEVFGRIFTYFCVCMCFVGLGISVVIKDVMQVVTEKAYWDAHLVVPVITLAYIISRFQLHFNIGIAIKKKTVYGLYINIATATINLLLNYYLIQAYGVWGAAYSVLVSMTFKTTLYYIVSNRLIPIVVEWSKIMRLFVVCGLLYWSVSLVDLGNPYINTVVKSFACLLLPVLLIVAGVLNRSEFRKGLGLVRDALVKYMPKTMARFYKQQSDKT